MSLFGSVGQWFDRQVQGTPGALKDIVTGDITNALTRGVGKEISGAVSNALDVGNNLKINELKTNGIIPNEINNPTGAAIALGGLLAAPMLPEIGAALPSIAGGIGSTVSGALGSVGLGGLSTALGSGVGAATGAADALLGGAGGLLGTATNFIMGNPLLLGLGAGKLLQGFGSNGSAPNPTAVSAGGAPTYDKTLLDAFNAQLAIEPQLLKANQLYQPQWLALQAQNQQQTAQAQLDLMKSLYPQAGQMEAAYQNQLRQNELQQISGPNNALQQYQNAFNALTPGVQGAITNTGLLAQGAMGRALYQPQFNSYEQNIPNPYQAAQMAAFQGMPISSMYGRPMIPAYPGIQQAQIQQQPVVTQQQPQVSYPKLGTEEYYKMVPDARPGAGLPRDDGNGAPAINLASSQPSAQNLSQILSGIGDQFKGLNLPVQGPQRPMFGGSANVAPAPQIQPQAAQTSVSPSGALIAEEAAPPPRQTAVFGVNDNSAVRAPSTMPYTGVQAQITPQTMSALPVANLPAPAPQQVVQAPAPVSPPAVVQQPIQPPVQPPIQVRPQQFQPTQQMGWQNAFNRYQMPMMRQPQAEDVVGTLGRQAMSDLGAGRSLTPEEQRIADQTARSAYAARGMALGNQAIGAEILNRADVANQRYLQRQQSAANIANQMMGLQNQQFTQGLAGAQFGLGAQQQQYAQAMGTQQSAFQQALQQSQADIQRAQAAQQLQAGQAQLGAGALSQLQAYQTPILQAFYKQSIMPNTVPQAQTMGLQNQQAAGNSLFNVESPMAFQSAFLPYQGNIALQSAQLQANAAKSAGQNSMFGNLGGSLIGALPKLLPLML